MIKMISKWVEVELVSPEILVFLDDDDSFLIGFGCLYILSLQKQISRTQRVTRSKMWCISRIKHHTNDQGCCFITFGFCRTRRWIRLCLSCQESRCNRKHQTKLVLLWSSLTELWQKDKSMRTTVIHHDKYWNSQLRDRQTFCPSFHFRTYQAFVWVM